MNYQDGQTVKIKDRSGNMITATILNKLDWLEESQFWVSYYVNGHKEVTVFTASQLDSWNQETDWSGLCVCGARKTNQPRHSYYCYLFEEN